MQSTYLAAIFSIAAIAGAKGAEPVEKVKAVPPPGIVVPAQDAARLRASLVKLDEKLAGLRAKRKGKDSALVELPDVEIYAKAVRYALEHDEFFDKREIPIADKLLARADTLADVLANGERLHSGGKSDARTSRVHAYVSKIDGSIQPYRVVIPPGFDAADERPRRLDFWFHGRNEKLSELHFIAQTSLGEFTPPDAFVVHLYGRYCNANKFAGEMDLFETLADVRRRYPIDEDRIVIRGFSMGGAACWHFAVHHPGRFVAAAPGAGFAETPQYLHLFQSGKAVPPWYVQKLWRLYDCPGYARSLFHCPTVAYSGEMDRQRQAADVMAAALQAEGMQLTHVIGPKTAHSYHPQAKVEINRRIDAIARRGRETLPRRVRFTTYSLRYPACHWVRLEGLQQHWEQARVDAEIVDAQTVKLTTANVSALSLRMSSGCCPLDATHRPTVVIDGETLPAPAVQTDRSWSAQFHIEAGRWIAGPMESDGSLRKIPGLQGPIDDAFMDSFLIVRPTGPISRPATNQWVQSEMKRAVEQWRKLFRGDARVKEDAAVTDSDVAECNLILWGDPTGNRLFARIADKLPIRWQGEELIVGGQKFPAASSLPILIFPNPLNPRRYVVLNSGFTFREADYQSNARQVPKLPDWAVVDVRVAPDLHSPGRIAAAGFFDERWRLVEQ